MKFGAVLPLSIRSSYDNEGLARADILFRSLSAFCEPGVFGAFHVVTPPYETEHVAERCERWPQFDIKAVSEEDLVPELKQHRHIRGGASSK